mmetsp:Transcript_16749/g.27187  ORF Transcript_16749/g.27187 Transcript_16749/m.27187 type:complete len:183 (-) Transcript_16749:202-750(-)|eukprot:CAMPEP_0178798820 /NCGR_PEP_ID=MMETSP0745-20121128/11962_1 /TAXON_ID=913974 /ORGANISM="Nitzschia punctata, Strain CCMP561" /LENGTH=182 /DNA_ID=CAMNT_0020457503 /DNA_START=8 /DNA_END=556 /DNA_ORIENTATION=+
MTTNINLLPLLLGFLALVPSNVAQDGCVVQTGIVNSNPEMLAAQAALAAEFTTQTVTCIDDGIDPCDYAVTAQVDAVETACTNNSIGQIYEPYFQLTCENDNTKTTTVATWQYAFCVGVNCTTDDYTEAGNTFAMNLTAAMNQLLEPQGVSCSALVADAAFTVGGFFLAIAAAAASMVFLAM